LFPCESFGEELPEYTETGVTNAHSPFTTCNTFPLSFDVTSGKPPLSMIG